MSISLLRKHDFGILDSPPHPSWTELEIMEVSDPTKDKTHNCCFFWGSAEKGGGTATLGCSASSDQILEK